MGGCQITSYVAETLYMGSFSTQRGERCRLGGIIRDWVENITEVMMLEETMDLMDRPAMAKRPVKRTVKPPKRRGTVKRSTIRKAVRTVKAGPSRKK